ncbi:hypothetical protein M2436_006809 [Streptomyces sp. HB372]|nr:hypothetical protein [Streptomyces sp. HB372]
MDGSKAALAGEEPFDDVICGGSAVQEDLAERGEFVLAPDAGQELVAEVPPQPAQCGTHRGLAEPYTLPCLGDVAFFEEGAEGHDEVEVETGQVHGTASLHVRCHQRLSAW